MNSTRPLQVAKPASVNSMAYLFRFITLKAIEGRKRAIKAMADGRNTPFYKLGLMLCRLGLNELEVLRHLQDVAGNDRKMLQRLTANMAKYRKMGFLSPRHDTSVARGRPWSASARVAGLP